jgi:hypothetical protein
MSTEEGTLFRSAMDGKVTIKKSVQLSRDHWYGELQNNTNQSLKVKIPVGTMILSKHLGV